MKFVIIGFSRGKGPFASLIRFFTGSEITHSYIRNGSMITHASNTSVHVEHIQEFIQRADILDEIMVTMTDDQYEEAEDYRHRAIDSPYSIMQILGFSLVFLGRRVGIPIKNPFSNGDYSYVCSELVARYLKLDNPEDLTPSDVYNTLNARR